MVTHQRKKKWRHLRNMPTLFDNGYMIRLISNQWLRDSENDELVALHHFFNKTVPERALIEFAARVCYNSTGRLGTAPNFVENVLNKGHLSVAEHPAFFIKAPTHVSSGGYRRPFIQKFEWLTLHELNRFNEFNQKAIFSNLRSLTETFCESHTNMGKLVSSTLAPLLPRFFESTDWDAVEDLTPANIYVPGTSNVQMLAFNPGSTTHVKWNSPRETKSGTIRNWSRYTFLIECSRDCSLQIARHRGASISQESQRYVEAKHNRGFVYPPDATNVQIQQMKNSYTNSLALYDELRLSGLKKEDARFILPGGIKTRMVISWNYNEFLHFLKLRTDKHAQWEIRNIATEMLKQSALVTDERKGKKLHELAETCFSGSGSV